MVNDEDWKKLVAKFDGKCIKCNEKINSGDEILWNLKTKEVKHVECPPSKSRKKDEDNDDENDSGINMHEESDEDIQRAARYAGYAGYDGRSFDSCKGNK